jgi:hypothetical protein
LRTNTGPCGWIVPSSSSSYSPFEVPRPAITYIRVPTPGTSAAKSGSINPEDTSGGVVYTTVPVSPIVVSTTETVRLPVFATYRNCPCESIARYVGELRPPLGSDTVPSTFPPSVVGSTTVTSVEVATYTRVPAGSIATSVGFVPTVTPATSVFPSITRRIPLFGSATYAREFTAAAGPHGPSTPIVAPRLRVSMTARRVSKRILSDVMWAFVLISNSLGSVAYSE